MRSEDKGPELLRLSLGIRDLKVGGGGITWQEIRIADSYKKQL